MAHMSTRSLVRLPLAIALMASVSLSGAYAQSGAGAPRAVSVVLASGVTFNWLVKKHVARSKAVENAVLVASEDATPTTIYGRGSYICSPAGFGQKSHCHAN